MRNVIIWHNCHHQYNQIFTLNYTAAGEKVCGTDAFNIAACGLYGSCVQGECSCSHGFSGNFCEVPPPGTPYTECRQVSSPTAGAVVFSRPCAAGTRQPDVAPCTRLQLVVPPSDIGSPAFQCGTDSSCWVETLVDGVRGNWLKLSESCDPTNTSDAVLADCPASACPAAAPNSSTCRQVGTPEGLTLRAAPCMTAERVADLVRGVTVEYTNVNSKQTSRCGAPPEQGVRPLCWAAVTVKEPTGQEQHGFLPVARVWEGQPGFKDAFCSIGSPQEPLLLDKCAMEAYVECRQVTKADGLPVHTAPCIESPLVSPPYTISMCERVELAVGFASGSVCSDSYSWMLVRYREATGSPFLQWGWVQVGQPSSGKSYMSFCPAFRQCPQPKSCRQVIDEQEVTLRAGPCWSSKALATLQTWDTVQYHGSYSKQTSMCPADADGAHGYDGLCWVKVDVVGKNGRSITGWLPAGRAPAALNKFQDAFCGSSAGNSILRSYCDLCIKKPPCPGPAASLRWSVGCWARGKCDPDTGRCSPAWPLPRGQPCNVAGTLGGCDGAGRCVQQAAGATIFEAEDKWLPSEFQDLLRALAPLAKGASAEQLAHLTSDVNALRLEGCSDYPATSPRATWCSEVAAQYFDSPDNLSASYDAEAFTPPPFCNTPGQCDHGGCHATFDDNCPSFPVPSFDTPLGELHDTTGMTDEDWEQVKYWSLQAVSTGAGFLPVVGEAVDIADAILGIDVITGEELSPIDRVLCAAGVLLPFVPGKALRAAKKALLLRSVAGAADDEAFFPGFVPGELSASSVSPQKTFKFMDRLSSAKVHAKTAVKAGDAPNAAQKIFTKGQDVNLHVAKARAIGLSIEHVGDVVVRLGRTVIKLKDGTRKSLWALDHWARGFAFEKVLIMKSQHLGRTFPVFDTFADGKLISLKTVQTASKTYQDVNKLRAVLEAYVKRVVGFEEKYMKEGRKLSWADVASGVRTEVRENGDVVRVASSGAEQLLTNYKAAGGVAVKELHIVIPPNVLDQARADLFSSHLVAFANDLAAAAGHPQQVFVKIIIAG